jgi:hypothetical protein
LCKEAAFCTNTEICRSTVGLFGSSISTHRYYVMSTSSVTGFSSMPHHQSWRPINHACHANRSRHLALRRVRCINLLSACVVQCTHIVVVDRSPADRMTDFLAQRIGWTSDHRNAELMTKPLENSNRRTASFAVAAVVAFIVSQNVWPRVDGSH